MKQDYKDVNLEKNNEVNRTMLLRRNVFRKIDTHFTPRRSRVIFRLLKIERI